MPKDAIAGKVKSVDMKRPSFTITLSSGKDRTFGVTKETEFWGPQGGDRGTGVKGLSDDCMAKGYDVKVAPTKDDKYDEDVLLANRKKQRQQGPIRDREGAIVGVPHGRPCGYKTVRQAAAPTRPFSEALANASGWCAACDFPRHAVTSFPHPRLLIWSVNHELPPATALGAPGSGFRRD